MTQLFRAARQNRIFQDVVEQIQEAIIEGRLKAGDRLPAERELKETLQTSRSTLREALRVLEQKGLIEIKLGTGGGAVVKTVSADLVSESLDLLIRSHQVSLRQIAEFRERVEGDVVVLATSRMKETDARILKALLNEARMCVDRGAEAVSDFLTADKNIHLYFAKITGNPIYISILKTIHENIRRYYDEFLVMAEPEMNENLQDLEDVVNAMLSGEAEKAARIASTHVRRFNGYMEIRERQHKV
ncbi:FadR/GntR family transcriptional regulator [Desulfosarcina sp.]|uniref:FadR/GntR family transcriptional regulator n=1 Tax=Desulfosarcina sp. TaxID=2027861 RepID=UPI003970DFA2